MLCLQLGTNLAGGGEERGGGGGGGGGGCYFSNIKLQTAWLQATWAV